LRERRFNGGLERIGIAFSLGDPTLRDLLAAEIADCIDLRTAESPAEADLMITDRAGHPFPAGHLYIEARPGREAPPDIRAILPASLSPRRIIDAARLVADGLVILSDREFDEAVPRDADAPTGRAALVHADKLTPREREVLQLLAAGASNKEIARSLDISVHTVKFHIASLLAKLGATSRLEAVGIGLRTGIIMV
jgi:DNA-binding CsgD family transcriptional regulator